MAKTQTAAQTAPAMDEAALAEMRRLIFDAPIAELAESQGISIDEAVKLRVEKNLEEAPMPVSVTVRPIEPQGKLLGFASVNFGGVVVDDFKVVDGKNGVFLGTQQARPRQQVRLPHHSAGNGPQLAGTSGRGGCRGLQRRCGKAGGPRRGAAPRPHP